MDWRASWLKERKTLVHTIIVLVLSVAFVPAGETITDYTSRAAQTIFYYPFDKLQRTMNHLMQAADNNQALTAQVVDLTTRIEMYTEVLEENRRLRDSLGFGQTTEVTIVPAEITGIFGTGVPNTVMINLGAAASLMENQTVINQFGLVGRVARVLDNYSVVYLLTEPRCRVSARIKRSREMGIIRYSVGRGMYLDNCPRQGDVVVGDTIITSGLGQIFPEAIVIGTVKEVSAPEKEFFYDIVVEPVVNFNGLDELYILKRTE
jgi:rod shape-determining protein MreC